MIGNVSNLTNIVTVPNEIGDKTGPSTSLHIPVQFYICKKPGLAVPLVAL
jgi:hypothetical protein